MRTHRKPGRFYKGDKVAVFGKITNYGADEAHIYNIETPYGEKFSLLRKKSLKIVREVQQPLEITSVDDLEKVLFGSEGLNVHCPSRKTFETLVDWFIKHYNGKPYVFNKPNLMAIWDFFKYQTVATIQISESKIFAFELDDVTDPFSDPPNIYQLATAYLDLE